MRVSLLGIAVVATAPLVQALRADIRADTNRDGVVDVEGESDTYKKDDWTNEHGALFLANIGDTDRRCSRKALSGPALEDDFFDRCNDASDNVLRQAKYLAPLRTVSISDISDEATGKVFVEEGVAAKLVRIFHRENGAWEFVTNSTKFTAGQLSAGLELGIDSRETRRPGRWDGKAIVKFAVEDGDDTSVDEVMLRVAPVLTHHHLQKVEQVLTTNGNETNSPHQAQFVKDLTALLPELGVDSPLWLFNQSDDVWAQDFIEPGYSSIPGPDGPISLRIHIRSGQDERVAGRQVFEYSRDTGIGAVQSLGGSGDDLNSMGNVETIPPYEHDGQSYPAGRIIIGSRYNWQHQNLGFFQAQEVQEPVVLDTEWLFIGHVDEFIQFLPADNERGWVIIIDDPSAGLEMFEKLIEDGHGDVKAFSRKDNAKNDTGDYFVDLKVPQYTISEMLDRPGFVELNKECARRIEANLKIVREATGVTDQEVFRLPALLEQARFRSNETLRAGAVYPGIINGVVMNEGKYLAPNPWGPIIDGKDVVAEDARKVYKDAVGMDVVLIDDFFSHHVYYGEVHCGTNTVRGTNGEWWRI